MAFPIGSSLQLSFYLKPFSRYSALSVLGSRVWPFNVTWRHRSRDHIKAHMPFLLWSFGTESLNAAVYVILRSGRIGVTSLTFQGYVTSTVTWPFDSPYAISYWCSFGTKLLSLKVSEIFYVECNAMVDVTLIRPLNKGQGHSFSYQSIYYIRLPIGSQ